ncbi:MAG: hypothetical protein M1323_03225 [Candidatus Thermoplasmatota archaeon]|nr:hypothetical protein [Candidatus Thermoplasmatota archaeon]
MMEVHSFNFSKSGNNPEETEDSLSINLEKLKFAIADGASDSIFSGQWAFALTNEFVNNNGDEKIKNDIGQFIQDSRKMWYESINWKGLKWNVKNKAVRGAYSTFLGISTEFGSMESLIVHAIGDSCIFIFDEGKMKSFPLNSPDQFGIHPSLVWSGYGFPLNNKPFEQKLNIKQEKFKIIKGNEIILATDAMSKFIMEAGEDSFGLLWDHYNDRTFFDDMRNENTIKNDDLSAILISF